MTNSDERTLKTFLTPFLEQNVYKVWAIFFAHAALYLAATAVSLTADNVWLRIAAALVAGLQIAALFVIGHDAAHGAFFRQRWLNAFVGRLTFLPSLHNYALWQVQHNKWHHTIPNVRNYNSWSPLSKDEYEALPRWWRALERFYRSLLGLGVYYAVERWWAHKFFPRRRDKLRDPTRAKLDFVVLLLYIGVWLAITYAIGRAATGLTFLETTLFGFVIPFTVWNWMMGLTVYLQHTSPVIPWYPSIEASEGSDGQHRVTMHVRTPFWYRLMSNEIMEHTAHHLQPKIPLYNLKAAQAELHRRTGGHIPQVSAPVSALRATLRACKLYDYNRRCWLDFDGRPTTAALGPPTDRATPPGPRPTPASRRRRRGGGDRGP